MQYAVQTQKVTANTIATFDFSANGTIGALVYGISGFQLSEPNNGSEEISAATISLGSPLSGTGVGYDTVQLQPSVTLTDSSQSDNWIQITVLAYIGGENPSNIYLENLFGLLGSNAPGAQTINGQPVINAAVLSGFSLNMSGNSELVNMGAGAGSISSIYSTSAKVTPLASSSFIGTKSEYSTGNTVDVGLAVFTKAQSGLIAGMYNDPQPSGNTIVDYSYSPPSDASHTCTVQTPGIQLTEVAVFLQSFFLQYPVNPSFGSTPKFTLSQVGLSSAPTIGTNDFSFTSVREMSDSTYFQVATGEGNPAYTYYPCWSNSYVATYFYIGLAMPGVSGVSPASGPTGGGTAVTISGQNLATVTEVYFGSTSAKFSYDSTTETIQATSPKTSTAGAVDITVSNAVGTSTTSAADQFTYQS